MTTVTEPYRLEIPATADFLPTARMFAAAVATGSGSEVLAGDIKLAVTEAASLLMEMSPTVEPISIEILPTGGGMRFLIARTGQLPEETSASPGNLLVGIDLARSFFPSLTVATSGDGKVTITFDTDRT